MAQLTGITQDGTEVPIQVKPDGRLVAEGLEGPPGPAGSAGDTHFSASGDSVYLPSPKLLGIGTASPSTALEVKADYVGGTGQLRVNGNSGQRYTGLSIANNGTGKLLVYHDNTDDIVRIDAQSATGSLVFGSNGEAFRVDSSKRLLVGTTNAPASSKQGAIVTTQGIYIQSANGTWWALGVSDAGQLVVIAA